MSHWLRTPTSSPWHVWRTDPEIADNQTAPSIPIGGAVCCIPMSLAVSFVGLLLEGTLRNTRAKALAGGLPKSSECSVTLAGRLPGLSETPVMVSGHLPGLSNTPVTLSGRLPGPSDTPVMVSGHLPESPNTPTMLAGGLPASPSQNKLPIRAPGLPRAHSNKEARHNAAMRRPRCMP